VQRRRPFVDRYEEALKALIAGKQKGHKPAKVAAKPKVKAATGAKPKRRKSS
jgi:non-homologous end joining protein Ku